MGQRFRVFCVNGDVDNVYRSHFARNAIGRSRPFPTGESLAGTLYLSERQIISIGVLTGLEMCRTSAR